MVQAIIGNMVTICEAGNLFVLETARDAMSKIEYIDFILF